jgi:pimeloyl-ACP methyl ester carboxylesterase
MLTYASFLLRGISSSFGFKAFLQDTIDYINGFDVVKLEKEERKQYLDMVASMLDHSDLLKDKKDLYTRLSARQIPLTLVLGEKDAIVPLSAGKRLKQTLQYARESHKDAVDEVILPATHSLPVELPRELLAVIFSAAAKAFSRF